MLVCTKIHFALHWLAPKELSVNSHPMNRILSADGAQWSLENIATLPDPKPRLLFCAGAMARPDVVVKQVQELQEATRRNVLGLMGSYPYKDCKAYSWAKVDKALLCDSRNLPKPFDLSELAAGATFVTQIVQAVGATCVIGFSQGSVVAMLAQMQNLAFCDVVAVCPGFVDGLSYKDNQPMLIASRLALIQAGADQLISPDLQHKLAKECGGSSQVLPGHCHQWSTDLVQAIADQVLAWTI